MTDKRLCPSRVRFVHDDDAALWKAGEEAEYLGKEWEDPDHPGDVNHLLRTDRGELLSLYDPFGRGVVEWA